MKIIESRNKREGKFTPKFYFEFTNKDNKSRFHYKNKYYNRRSFNN